MNNLKGIIEDCNKSDLVSKKVIKKVIEIIGQEEWNDLNDEHSDICTTIGELIITLEGIPDLEKENAELDCQKNRNKYCYSCANATERCFKNEIGCPCDKYKSYKEDLEQKISVLLSCKNCSENKGGFICQKEYEDKCLAQKIQFIKELQQGNAELKKTYRKQRNKRIDELQKANAELKKQLEMSNKVYNDNLDYSHHIEEQFTKAKDHIKKLLDCLKQDTNDPQTNYYVVKYMAEAEQFFKD